MYELQNFIVKPRLTRPRLFRKFENYIRKPCYDFLGISDSQYCLAASDGKVYVLNAQSGNTDSVMLYEKHNELMCEDIIKTKLFKSAGQKLLAGTNYGINMYDISGGNLNLIRSAVMNLDTKKFSQVLDFYEDTSFFWIATLGSGLFKFDKNLNLLSNYTVENGLCNNIIYSIAADGNGNLLLATSRGLSVYNINKNRFLNYYTKHGLFSQEFQTFGKAISVSGIIFFSTLDGVMKVKALNQELINPYSFDIIINKLTLGNRNLTAGDLILLNESRQFSLDYGKSLAISFEVVNLPDVHDYGLQYKLNNDKQWQEISIGSQLIFERLNAGVQKLYVKGRTDNNNISINTSVYTLNINPLYYQQWWFVTAIAASLVFLIYLLYRYRINQLKRLLEIRTKISRDLHDEIGSTLSGIFMYSHLTKEQIKNAQTSEVEKSLNIIQQSAGEMVNKLNDIVWFINPKQDSLQKLVQRLEEYANDMSMIKKMQVRVSIPASLTKQSLPLESRRNIYLFCKEAINNAVKYSNATLLELTIKEMDNELEFSVEDNGKGFDTQLIKRGNGLENMQKRADEIGAKFILQSKPDGGCVVSMQTKITR